VHTFPNRDRLSAFLTLRRWEDCAAEITMALDLTIRTAEQFLYNYPGGVPWTAAFEAEFSTILQQTSPWLDEAGVARMRGFAGWLCWHEGLNRTQ
jgi:hypothetical protein